MLKRLMVIFLSITILMSPMGYSVSANAEEDIFYSQKRYPNIGFDLNGTENRAELRNDLFENWIIEGGNEAIYEVEGLKFTLTNETGSGELLSGSNRALYDEVNPDNLLTLDGLSLSKVFKNGIIKLQIEGLPEGVHTITTWHSYYSLNTNSSRSTMAININGKDVVTGAQIPCKVESDDDAYISYSEFEAKENEAVVIYFKSEGNGTSHDIPVLNAFELNGIHPLMDIENPLPEDGESHFNPEDNISWEMADGAVSSRFYFGTDKYLVDTATTSYSEYKGEFQEAFYDLSEYDLSHMQTYYWRVDQVFENGAIVKGNVCSFKIRHLAFPTAEGYGRFANGGRGGQIIEVTSLEDGYNTSVDSEGNEIKTPMEGTLRWAIESFSCPRIIVFKVGGVIRLCEGLIIDAEHDDVYIAGQTAPGDGITLINYPLYAVSASDVIIRNIRVRVGDSSDLAEVGMALSGCDNSIIDHCSISWATDENFSSRNSKNITLQRSILAEGLHTSSHSPEDVFENPFKSYAASVSGDIASYHHNLLVNNGGRNWSLAGGISKDGLSYTGNIDIRNNVVYNWYNETTSGSANQIQFVGNYYKMGHGSLDMDIFSIEENPLGLSDAYAKAYLNGNKLVDLNSNVLLDPVNDDSWMKATIIKAENSILDNNLVRSENPFFESYISAESADEAYESVLSDVGAVVPALDYIDQRYIKEVEEGTYTYTGSKNGYLGLIDTQEDAEGYPDDTNFKGGEAPLDTDHDGMPDEWETKHGLNPEDYNDASQIYLSDEGYTNIELYLNELMGDPVVYSDNPTLRYPIPSATPEVTEIPYLLGDLDDNGKVDAADALLVLKHAAKIEILAEEKIRQGDVDVSGTIDAGDALLILKKAAKLIENFPIEEDEVAGISVEIKELNGAVYYEDEDIICFTNESSATENGVQIVNPIAGNKEMVEDYGYLIDSEVYGKLNVFHLYNANLGWGVNVDKLPIPEDQIPVGDRYTDQRTWMSADEEEINYPRPENKQGYSMSFWAKTDKETDDSAILVFADETQTMSVGINGNVRYQDGSYSDNCFYGMQETEESDYSTGEWHYYTITFANDWICFYVDGVEVPYDDIELDVNEMGSFNNGFLTRKNAVVTWTEEDYANDWQGYIQNQRGSSDLYDTITNPDYTIFGNGRYDEYEQVERLLLTFMSDEDTNVYIGGTNVEVDSMYAEHGLGSGTKVAKIQYYLQELTAENVRANYLKAAIPDDSGITDNQ